MVMQGENGHTRWECPHEVGNGHTRWMQGENGHARWECPREVGMVTRGTSHPVKFFTP